MEIARDAQMEILAVKEKLRGKGWSEEEIESLISKYVRRKNTQKFFWNF
jgi:hypothetical protein